VASQIEKVSASPRSHRLRVALERLLGGHGGSAKGADHIAVMRTSLDRREISPRAASG
jgi:hypothetical protein